MSEEFIRTLIQLIDAKIAVVEARDSSDEGLIEIIKADMIEAELLAFADKE
jgi:hypothetical protein